MLPESGQPRNRDYGFPKTSRLLKRRQFLSMSDRSVPPDLKIRAGGFLVVGRVNELGRNRVGVTVTKKVGPAVTRNLIKRLARELFRLNNHRWPAGLDYVFIARPEAGSKSRAGLTSDLALAGKKIAAWSFPVLQKTNFSRDDNRPRPTRVSAPEDEPPAENPGAVDSPPDFFSFLLAIPGRLALGLIFLYQRCISPLLPPACRFWPTCSNYAASAIKIHGFWLGSYLAARRLLKCHPFHPGGYDPVPPRKETDPRPTSPGHALKCVGKQ